MMKKFMKKLWEKKDSKKGFTLVELIVVLVILAILAAIMIPAMLGWIDKAREKQLVLEGRTALLAAQSVASEEYGKPTPVAANVTGAVGIADIEELAELDTGTVSAITLGGTGGFVVEGITYTPTGGKQKAVYTVSGGWVVSDKQS